MVLTLSSLLISLGVSTLLILSLTFLIKKCFPIKYLGFLALLIFLTLCFPVEYFFSAPIVAPKIMNPIDIALKLDNSREISKTSVALCIYFIGVLIKLILFIKETKIINEKFKILTHNSEKYHLDHFLPYSRKNYPVYFSEYVNAPFILGFNKAIFIPSIKFNKQELLYILEHEKAHIIHHDILIKYIMNILTIIYWWFYPVYVFQKNINLLLEIRVDDFVTKHNNDKEKSEYAQTLVNVQKKYLITANKNSNPLRANLIDKSIKMLDYRIQYLINPNGYKYINTLVLILLLTSSITTHFISLKTFYKPPIERDYITETNLKERNAPFNVVQTNSTTTKYDKAEYIYVKVDGHVYKRLWNGENGQWEDFWQFVS